MPVDRGRVRAQQGHVDPGDDVRWGNALGSEPRISGPRDAPTRSEPIHINVSSSSSLARIASAPSGFPSFSLNQDRRFLNIERSRITWLVSRLATPIAPRGHPPSGSRRPQTVVGRTRIRESYRRCRRTRMFIGRFYSLAPFVLFLSSFSSPVLP